MTSCSCARPSGIGRFLWKKGDGMIIDGLGPDGISARVLDAARGAVRLQSGYVYHYALAMLLGVVALATWFMAHGRRAMSGLPLLSPRHLPAAARRGCDPGDAAAPTAARWIALITTIVDLRSVAAGVGAVRHANRRLPAGGESSTGWAAASPITWAWTAFPCCSWC